MINKDIGLFPFFTPELRQALDRELDAFLDHVLGSGGSLDELFLADYTFPSPALAPLYGDDLLDPPGDHTRARLAPNRRGLLSSPAYLAVHALVDQTNPVDRGLMVRARLFCQGVPDPPADVIQQKPAGGAELTTRQKYEHHLSEARCRTCHRYMDPLGFGFEQFDALGRFRTSEGRQAVDARGEIVGTDVDGPFTGPAELAQALARSPRFHRCFAQQLWRFAEGRAVEDADGPEISLLADAFAAKGNRIDELVVAMVRKRTFVLRRAPLAGEAP